MAPAENTLVPLVFEEGSLGIKSGPTLLTDIPEHAFQSSQPSRSSRAAEGSLPNGNLSDTPSGALIGFHSLSGRSHTADISIGKVCRLLCFACKKYKF